MSELIVECADPKEGEDVKGIFPCQMDYIKGVLVLTNERMLFIQGGGRFNTVYSKCLESKYEDILEIKLIPGERLRFRLKDDPYSHLIETIDVKTRNITLVLEEFVDIQYFDESSRPKIPA
jgi:hypothetical protein